MAAEAFAHKSDLVRHLASEHPALVFPDLAGLRTWSRGELDRTHAELHEGDR